jgi:hypothetical protein
LLLVEETLSEITKKEYYKQKILNSSIKDITVKENELVNLNRSQNPDSFKAYIIKCNWKSLFTLANCKLMASFGVNYIDFNFSYHFSLDLQGFLAKIFFFFFFFFFFGSVASL